MYPAKYLRTLFLAVTAFSAITLTTAVRADAGPEALLNQIFESINQNRLDKALTQVEALLRTNPNFRLANLIKGDLLIARARPLRTLGDAPNAPRERLDDLRAEAMARLKAYREPPPAGKVPRYILEMQPAQRYAVVVDAERARLFLYQNVGGVPKLAADYYISAGKRGMEKVREGDEKTPIGVYYVTANLPRSKLTDFYGSGPSRSVTRTSGTSDSAAMATASGCTAHPRIPSAALLAPATAAWFFPTRTSTPSPRACRSG